MKISVIGYSGSGKSTLAAALGRRYGAEVLHLARRARFTRVVRRRGNKVTVVKNQRALTCLYQREGLA